MEQLKKTMETLKKTMEKLKKTMEKLKRHEPQKKFQNCKKKNTKNNSAPIVKVSTICLKYKGEKPDQAFNSSNSCVQVSTSSSSRQEEPVSTKAAKGHSACAGLCFILYLSRVETSCLTAALLECCYCPWGTGEQLLLYVVG
jgi:hypothetical protein